MEKSHLCLLYLRGLMKHQLKTTIIVATLALSSILSLGSIVQAVPVDNAGDNTVDNNGGAMPGADPSAEPSEEANAGTQFTCVPQGSGNVATVGQRPGGEPIPIIIWTPEASKYFGDKYSPQNRCKIVTPKLNEAVAESGGSLKDVVLMSGQTRKQTVICVVSLNDKGCDETNVLFTLNPKNAKKADQILSQIMQISREGSSAGVIRETKGRVQIRLSDLLNRKTSRSPRQIRRKPAIKNNTGGL
jgi:hypothetical protein